MMVNYTKYIIGLLTILIAVGVIYVQFNNAQIRIDKDKAMFYINKSGWKIAAVENIRLFQETKLINRYNIGITIWNETKDNKFIIYRTTPYSNGASVLSKWVFNLTSDNIELFPEEETHTIHNCKDCYLRYSLDQLTNVGLKRKLTTETSIRFGYNMKLTFPSGYSWGWIGYPYGGDSFSLQYKIPSNNYTYQIRLFDPVSNLRLDNYAGTNNYELGSIVQIYTNGTGTICLDINHTRYGYNYTCFTDSGRLNVSFPELYVILFNDSVRNKILTTSNTVISIITSNKSDVKNISLNLNSTSYIENLKVDVGNNNSTDLYIPGKIIGDSYLTVDKFSNNKTNETLYFSSKSITFLREIILPDKDYIFTFLFELSGIKYVGDFVLNFTNTIYKDTSNTGSTWDTILSRLSMKETIYNYVYSLTKTVDYGEGDDGSSYSITDLNSAFDNDTDTYATIYSQYTYIGDYGTVTYDMTFDLSNLTATTHTLKHSAHALNRLGDPQVAGFVLTIYNQSSGVWDTLTTWNSPGSSYLGNDFSVSYVDINDEYRNATNQIRLKYTCTLAVDTTGTIYLSYNLYDILGIQQVRYETRPKLYQNTTTLSLFTSSVNINNITLRVNTSNQAADIIHVWLRNDESNSWVNVPNFNVNVTINFTDLGDNLKAKIELGTTNNNSQPYVNYISLINLMNNYPTNISIDFGDDGTYLYLNTSIINETVKVYSTTNNSFNSYNIKYCTEDSYTSVCKFPIRIKSDSAGILNISKINISTTQFNPINLVNISNLNCITTKCEVKLNITWFSGTNLGISPSLAYMGHGNVTITARDTSGNIISYLADMWYSPHNDTFPNKIYYWEFKPRSAISKNVSAYGQSNSISLFNITMLNKGDRTMNLSIMINESSCVNLTYSVTNNKSQGTIMRNNTWYSLFTNKDYLSTGRIWFWADYYCNNSNSWQLWYPDVKIKGCAYNSTCNNG